MKIIRAALLLAFPLYLISCSTQKKIPNYLDNVTDTSYKEGVKVPELRIQKNDILSIQVYSSSIDPKADEIYNLRVASTSTGTSTAINGFLVDARGNIEYPRLGSFHAEGLLKEELAEQIKKKLTVPDTLLRDPAVIIRFLNLKITVIGEVKSPGVLSIPGERVTILEAIGLAGDIDEFGMKEAVKVIREIDGKREVGLVNLSSDSLFISPFYNLAQNDVVLVQTSSRKAKRAEDAVTLQRVSIGLSIITTLALLYSLFR